MVYVTPHTGVWIETKNQYSLPLKYRQVTPHTGVWIET